MRTEVPPTEFFVAGGTLGADVLSYVQRPTDDELFELALTGEFCYVLTPRQMGKSSLMVRTAQRLQERGVQTAIIDLTAIGTGLSVERWYLGLLSGLRRRLSLSMSPEAWWQARSAQGYVQRFIEFVRDVVLGEVPGQVVIFIDEIDTTLKLDFRDDFFAAIRAMYNERAADPEYERLTFVLLGVASPTELIKDPARTPFNIGHPITLEEFSRDDAAVLSDGLEEIHPGQGKEAFDRIYYWTNGHPYLTQKLCLAVAEPEDELGPDVDGLVEELFLSEEARRETNLQFVQDKILTHPQRDEMLDLYKDVVRRRRVWDDGQSPVQIQLKLSGLVKVENGTLRVRNKIYQRAFDRAWVRRHTAINLYPIIIGVLAAILLVVVGLLAYDVWAGIRFNDCATSFYQTDDPNRRLEDLACAFKLRTLVLPANYTYQAQDMFSGLSRGEQLDLIKARGGESSDRVVVVRNLYVTLADVDETDSTGPLLDEMARALRFVDGEEPDSLIREIEAWRRGRASAREGREEVSFGATETAAAAYNAALGQYDQAISEALDYGRENAATLYERARVLTALERYADALDDLEGVAAIASRGPQATPTPRPTLPITPTRRRTATPTRGLTPTLAPTKGPTLTRIPSTPLLAITPTATRTPIATATRTPSPTPTPTQSPTPEPTPTPEPAAIEARFITPSQIFYAVRALINANPGLVEMLVRAPAGKYPNLQAAGLAPTPTLTPTPTVLVVSATTRTPTPTVAEETSIVIAIPKDPAGFNTYMIDTGYEQLLMELVLLGLTDLDPEGNIFLELAAEIPTEENGGLDVNWDARTMSATWVLRDDVFWADGEQVTADDVIFTWNAIADPETGIWAEGVDYTESLEKIDDYSFVVHYNTIYPNYRMHFGGEKFVVWPEHYCDASQGFVSWDCNREPLSNGPFILEEWATGDYISFVPNPSYVEEGKPYVDNILVRIVPERAVIKTMLVEGDADVYMWLTPTEINDLEAEDHIGVTFSPTTRWLMRLIPNLAARGEIDAEANPHPILADVAVRQAIRMAIDVDTLVSEVFLGYNEPIWTEMFRPPYACDNIPRPEYDPEDARALLEEAGWTDQDGDGIRECHGCANAEEGYVMSMENMIYAEYGEELELAQQLIAEMLGDVGIELELSSVEAPVLWADYESGGIEQQGDFDLNMWDDGYPGIDPTDHLWVYYYSSAAEPDYGWNVGRWYNEDFDALLDEAYTLDEEYRQELFCQMAEVLETELPQIILWTEIDANGYNKRVEGVQATASDIVTWNVADWKVVEP